jgi:8-oxo-dGTP diphosphatase
MNELRVVGAAIICDGRCFAALRGLGRTLAGYWEFPGGKVKAGETDDVALIREIHEELGAVVRVGQCLGESIHGDIRLVVYTCVIESGTLENQEHAEVRWLAAEELDSVTWAPADIPFLQVVGDVLRGR